MIVVKVILHSFLVELLPSATKGRIALELPDEARISDVMEELSIPKSVVIALNEQIERDPGKILKDGDVLRFLRPGAGG